MDRVLTRHRSSSDPSPDRGWPTRGHAARVLLRTWDGAGRAPRAGCCALTGSRRHHLQACDRAAGIDATSSTPSPRGLENVSWLPHDGHSKNSNVPSGSGPRHPVGHQYACRRRTSASVIRASPLPTQTSVPRHVWAARLIVSSFCAHDRIHPLTASHAQWNQRPGNRVTRSVPTLRAPGRRRCASRLRQHSPADRPCPRLAQAWRCLDLIRRKAWRGMDELSFTSLHGTGPSSSRRLRRRRRFLFDQRADFGAFHDFLLHQSYGQDIQDAAPFTQNV